jgi:hypothetical protein
MSVVAGVAKAVAGTKVLTGTRPAGRPFPRTERAVVVAVALLALVALAALIPAAQAPSSEQSSAASTDSQSGAGAAPVSEPAAPQMSEEEAIDAYGKLPLSCFFFSHKGATLSFAEGKRRGHALALNFLRSDPDATLTAQKRLSGKVNYLVGDDPAEWQQGLATHAELLYGGLWPGIDMTVRGEGGNLKYEFRLKPDASVEEVRLGYRGAEGLSVGPEGAAGADLPGVLKDAAPVSYYQRVTDGQLIE